MIQSLKMPLEIRVALRNRHPLIDDDLLYIELRQPYHSNVHTYSNGGKIILIVSDFRPTLLFSYI